MLPSDIGIDPEHMDRYIQTGTDVDDLAAAMARAFPGLAPRPVKVIPCLVTDSPDGQFLIGRLPGQPRVIIAGGNSGHGFRARCRPWGTAGLRLSSGLATRRA